MWYIETGAYDLHSNTVHPKSLVSTSTLSQIACRTGSMGAKTRLHTVQTALYTWRPYSLHESQRRHGIVWQLNSFWQTIPVMNIAFWITMCSLASLYQRYTMFASSRMLFKFGFTLSRHNKHWMLSALPDRLWKRTGHSGRIQTRASCFPVQTS